MQTPLSHSILKLKEFPFPIIIWELRFYSTDWADPFLVRHFTNQPCIMKNSLQSTIYSCSLRSSDRFWSHSGRTFFPVCLVLPGYYISILALWGNKNWPPSMKVKKFENFQNKSGSKGCKWSSLDVPGTQTPLSHPILKFGEFPFPIIGPLG